MGVFSDFVPDVGIIFSVPRPLFLSFLLLVVFLFTGSLSNFLSKIIRHSDLYSFLGERFSFSVF